jgi:TonB-linked SusC/RagA family outer membrane protein
MRTITRARALVIALIGGLFAIATPGLAEAQNAVITGKVTSEFGQNIEGANVYINDLAISTLTTSEGNFTITIPAARVQGQLVNLRVRAVGYAPQARPVRVTAGSQTFNFQMKQDINRLDEIVVTGSIEGTERAKVPFAIARLTQEELPVPAVDPLRALQGKVSGVRIAQANGKPGTVPEILMRGPTMINANGRSQSPLIIIDGAIMNVGSLEELGGLDIESVEVVKGAAGASLYGTRAANGVITIKTKRGASNEGVRFNVRSEYGVSDLNSTSYGQPVNHHLQLDETGKRFCVAGASNVASCSKTFDWMFEVLRFNGVAADTIRAAQAGQYPIPSGGSTGGELTNVYQAQIWPNQYYNTFAQMSSLGQTTLNAVDASGKMAGVRFYVSGSYQNEEGSLKHLDGIQSRRGRVNLDYDVRNDVLVSVSTMYDLTTNDLRNSFFGGLLRGAPPGTNYLARDTLGRAILRGHGGSGGAGHRPTTNGAGGFVYQTENETIIREAQRFLGNISASYFPADWVTVEGTFAYDNRQRRDEDIWVKGYRTATVSSSTNRGGMSVGDRQGQAYNGSLTATFRHQFMTDLNTKFSLRGLFDRDDVWQNSGQGVAFVVKDIFTLSNTTESFEVSSSTQTIKNQGFFAGASADYKGRYILDGTFRYDGSSLFGAGNRWAPFGRVSGVWRVSEESFFNVPKVSDFRLRVSHGTAGSTPRFSAQYETFSCSASGCSLGQAGNKNLKPETTTETEIGTDLTLFDRLGIEFTNARSSTRDQILNVPTPATLGFTNQWQNAGTLANNTYELAMNMPVMNRRDFSWSMRGTWDRTRTHITELFTPEYFTSANASGGSGSFFLISADRGNDLRGTGPKNRYGNVWGRRWYKSCGELPATVQPDCGGAGKAYQVNDEGWVVWTGGGNNPDGTPVTWRDGIKWNRWQTKLSTAQSPWAAPLFWGHPILERPIRGETGAGVPGVYILGNVMPDFRMTYANNVQWKRFTLYGLFDGTFGHEIFNLGEHWGLLDFSSSKFDQAGKSIETAKPAGYTWRAESAQGTGGFYDIIGPTNYNLEDGTYVKLREVSLTYRVGAIRGVGDWTIGLVGRNLLTMTNYSGYDPELGVSGGATGSALINQVDDFDFPTLRTYTFSLSTRF